MVLRTRWPSKSAIHEAVPVVKQGVQEMDPAWCLLSAATGTPTFSAADGLYSSSRVLLKARSDQIGL